MRADESIKELFSKYFPGILLWLRFPAFISWIAISVAILILSFLNTGKFFFIQGSLYHYTLAAATIALTSGIIVKRGFTRFLLFFLTGCLVYLLYVSNKEHLFSELKGYNGKLTVYGKVTSPSLPYPKNIRFLLRVDSSSLNSSILNGKTILCMCKDSAVQGSKIKMTGSIQIPGRKTNPFEFDEFSYLMSNGISTKFKVDSIEITPFSLSAFDKISCMFRTGISRIISLFTDSNQRAILFAAFLGETEYLSTDLKNSFRISGVYHLLSISGLHAAMLIGACYFLLNFLPIPVTFRHIIALITIWSYQVFIGFIPCLFRATVMASLIIITFLLQRKSYPVQSIGLAGSIWLLLSPDSLFQPGYQLSFAATFGILTIYPVLNKFTPNIHNRHLNYSISSILSSLYLSFTGMLSTLPIILYYFGSVPVYGLIANLVAVPIMTIAMWLFFFAIPFSYTPISFISVFFCKQALSALVMAADFFSSLPLSTIYISSMRMTVLFTFIVVCISIATVHKKYRAFILLLCIPILMGSAAIDILCNQHRDSVIVTKFNTEQMSMYAVDWANGSIWLFMDCSNSKAASKYLKTAQTWLHHQGSHTFDAVLYTVPPQVLSDIQMFIDATSASHVFHKSYKIIDSMQCVQSFSLLTSGYQNICKIVNRNDTLFTGISKGQNELLIVTSRNSSYLKVLNKKANKTEFISQPCIVNLKKTGCKIRYIN